MHWRGDILWLSQVKAGYLFYNAGRPKGSPFEYRCSCTLPAAHLSIFEFETKSEAMAALEKCVNNWLARAGLEATP